jgi:alpha-mannosidase
VQFRLAPVTTGAPNAVVAKGQTIGLPQDLYNRVYVLAASAEGDQKASFKTGSDNVELTVQNWGGFIGQWDDRQWSPGINLSKGDLGKLSTTIMPK